MVDGGVIFWRPQSTTHDSSNIVTFKRGKVEARKYLGDVNRLAPLRLHFLFFIAVTETSANQNKKVSRQQDNLAGT